jgi:lambda family phage portal protein
LNLTFEQLSGDLTGVTYSSIRAGMLEFRRWCEQFQYHCLIQQICEPIWRPWMEQAILAGVLGDVGADYRKNPQDFLAVRWDPPGWDWVDPQREVAAAKAAVRAGFDWRERVTASKGENVEDIDEGQKRDNDRADALGIKYDSDGRNPDGGPTVSEQISPDNSGDPAPGADPNAPANEPGSPGEENN